MTLRGRLVLWYGALFALALLVVTVLTYAVHARGHYDDRDRLLVTSAERAAAEAASMPNGPHLVEGQGGLEIGLRYYDAAGVFQGGTASTAGLPLADPRAVLRSPAGPAYDPVAGLLPPVIGPPPASAGGVFGLFSAEGQRWRSFVLPLAASGQSQGYVESLTPLGALDESIAAFRLLVLGLGSLTLVLTLAGSAVIAQRALRPVADMTGTARTIALSRDFSHRVPLPASRDELGALATTFNEMLDSLEQAYQTQQRFVSDASHELRTPLTAIQANLELLERQPDMLPAERQEAVAEASRETHRLSRLVADLLTLARADSGLAVRHQTVDLDQVVLDVLGEARHLTHGQRLAVGMLEPCPVRGDCDRLKQLLLILVDNAIKYTPAGGRIALGLQRDAGAALLSVQDSGIGIPEGDLPHVFERFYRADPARSRDPGGTGLGLAIARWIVDQHAGEIAVASTAQSGTNVTVRLPLEA